MNAAADALARFIAEIERDEALRTALAMERDHARFAERCAELAATRGLAFSAGDVRALLQQRHLAWLQRHVL